MLTFLTTLSGGRLRARRVLLLGLALALLAGCRSAKEGERPRTTDARPVVAADMPPLNPELAKSRGTLTIWLAADYAASPIFADLDAEFSRAYPGVRVKLLGVPWEDIPTKVKTAIIGGKPPDIAHYHPFALGAQGFAEPVDDLWQAWGRERDFLPGAMEDVTWRQHRYGVPLDVNCTVLLYNRQLLARHGVAEPGPDYGLSQWRQDLRRLSDPARQQYGVGLTSGGWHTFAFVLANGGDVLTEKGGRMRATLDDPRTVEAVRYMARLGREDQVGPVPTTKAKDYEDATTLFTMGKVAMIYTGPWDFATVTRNAPGLDFGVSPLPAGLDGVQRGSVLGGGSLFVPKGAPHRALAFEWMKWATSDRFAMRLARELGRYPVRRALYRDPFFSQDPRVATFVSALSLARPYRLDAYPQANQAFMDAVKASFYGSDPAFELARAQKVAQLAIDAQEGQ